jgi:hypothetical protein
VPDLIGSFRDSAESLVIALVVLTVLVTVIQVVVARRSTWPAVTVALAGALALWMVNSVTEIAWWAEDAANTAYREGQIEVDRGRFETGVDREDPWCLIWATRGTEYASQQVPDLICPPGHEWGNRNE